jgi:excinuclease UvrABC nuclease subunit
MSPTSPPINQSQAVERIREIIVGRQLERLEQRVVQLEAQTGPEQSAVRFEDRLCTAEARLEALQHSLQRLSEHTREESASRSHQQRAEIQRLAMQIQQIAASRAAAASQPAIEQLEARIGTWLGNWQQALQNHLNHREEQLAGQLRAEVATLWENTESQITRLESRSGDRQWLEQRFAGIAAAARALAAAADPDTPAAQPAR